MIEVKRINPSTEEVREIIILGTISFHEGRQYPWFGCHGGVCQYFSTKSEAVQYARTGKP